MSVPFNDVLRKIPRCVTREVYELEDRGFETRSFSQLVCRYPSRFYLLSCSSHQLDSRMSRMRQRRKRTEGNENRERRPATFRVIGAIRG